MKRKKKKKASAQQAPQVSAPDYSVDEILSQFWENYDGADLDAAGTDADETWQPDAVPASESFDGEEAWPESASLTGDGFAGAEDPEAAYYADEADDAEVPEGEPTWSVRDILEEYRDSVPASASYEMPEADFASGSASGAASGPVDEEQNGLSAKAEGSGAAPEAEEIDDLSFDLPYSLRDIMREYWSAAGSSGEEPEPAGMAEEDTQEDRTGADWPSDGPGYGYGDGDAAGAEHPEISEPAYPASEAADEPLDFSWGALLWGRETDGAAETSAPAEEDSAVPEPSGDESEPEASADAWELEPFELETKPEPQTPEPQASESGTPEAGWRDGDVPARRRPKVWEEFPDTPKPSDEPFVDTLDYAALFKMFAEDPASSASPAEAAAEGTGNPAGAGEGPDASGRREEAGEDEGWFAGSGLSPEEVIAAFSDDSSDAPRPGDAADREAAGESGRRPVRGEGSQAGHQAAHSGEAPLLADRDGEMDFRDILREFMMGDQHPIYADMPGIGIKAGSPQNSGEALQDSEEAPQDSEEAPQDSEEEQVPPTFSRPRRDYIVEEDFPPDLDALMSGREDGDSEAGPAGAHAVGAHVAEASAATDESAFSDEAAAEEPEESGLRGKLRTILSGRSLRAARRPETGKGLNEPKAYVTPEDYIPDEETALADAAAAEAARAAAQAAGEGGAHAAASGAEAGDLPTGFGGASGAGLAGTGDEGAWPADAGAEGLSEEDLLDYEADFPSFGQWILNSLMNVWIKLNGVGDRQSTATMEDEREDPGPEMNVAAASRYYGAQVTMLRMRFQLGLALLAVLAYITLGFPVTGMLKTAKVASAVCLGLQLTVLLLCLDVVTNALVNLTRGRFGADGLAVLACVVTSFDALVVAVGGFGSPHIPLCLFSSLALVGVLFSSLLSARALRKSTRVPAIGKRAYCVTAEEGVRGGKEITLLKSIRPVAGFVRRAEEAPPDETLFNRFALPELLVILLLSLLTGLVKHSMRDFLYILSAMLSCAVPFTALTAFALPYFVGSQRIFSSGAAVAGWSGIHDIGCSRNLIVTDRDLFPEDTVSIDTVRVFADESAERVIAYAGTMVAASGSGLGPSFSELMERNGCRMRQVEDFQWLSGGGLQGRIEGHTVLCGSADLMQLMNVKIPYRLVDRTTVLLAIDGVLYGIFKVSYTGLPEIRSALQELIASNRHPIFAIRDFNVTPDMLHEVFDVATDGYDFPPYGDRFRISEAQPSETSKVSAVVCREGLGPLTHLADTGRSMYVAVRLNLLVTVLTALLGTLLVFFRLIGPGLLNAWLPFVLMLLDLIAVTLITVFMRF